jgi:hypothetical protein
VEEREREIEPRIMVVRCELIFRVVMMNTLIKVKIKMDEKTRNMREKE